MTRSTIKNSGSPTGSGWAMGATAHGAHLIGYPNDGAELALPAALSSLRASSRIHPLVGEHITG